MGSGAFGDPGFGNNLGAVPVSVVEKKKSEACHVAGGDPKWVGGVARCFSGNVSAVVCGEIGHSDRFGDSLLERGMDFFACFLFVDGSEGVKIPVVVVVKSIRFMRMAFGPS